MTPEMTKICLEFLNSIKDSRPMDWSPLASLVDSKMSSYKFANNGLR